jgi:surface protein
MKTFEEFLNERTFKGTILPKVNIAKLKKMILTGEDISLVDYSEISNMDYMFHESHITFDLLNKANLDTSLVNSMSMMFGKCKELTEIPKFDTSNVTNMGNMFYGCSSLVSLPSLNTSNVNNMSYMFANCTKLKIIPHLNTSNVNNMSYMFFNCYKLETLDNAEDFKNYNFKDLPKILEKYPELRK